LELVTKKYLREFIKVSFVTVLLKRYLIPLGGGVGEKYSYTQTLPVLRGKKLAAFCCANKTGLAKGKKRKHRMKVNTALLFMAAIIKLLN